MALFDTLSKVASMTGDYLIEKSEKSKKDILNKFKQRMRGWSDKEVKSAYNKRYELAEQYSSDVIPIIEAEARRRGIY